MVDTSTEAGSLLDARLREEQIIWLTTVRADGQPQSVPVWFLWDGETILIYSRRNKQKLPNIEQNARVALHLNSDPDGIQVTRLQGRATIDPDQPTAEQVPEFIEKYRRGIARIGMTPDVFGRTLPVAVRIRPTWFNVR